MTNYHYIVPEFHADDRFTLAWSQLFDEVSEAQTLGYQVKPVLLGPLSYLYLGKSAEPDFDRLTLLPRLLVGYQAVLAKLSQLGIEWVQIDEPILALDLESKWQDAFKLAYQILRCDINVLLTTYFGAVNDKLSMLTQLAVDGLHIDLSAAPEQLNSVLAALPEDWVLSLGIINGRNIWRADLAHYAERLRDVKTQLGARCWIASSCSLLHSPVDLSQENGLDPTTYSWFAFAKQKMDEIALLHDALEQENDAQRACEQYSAPLRQREQASEVHKPHIRARLNDANALSERALSYAERVSQQRSALNLPLFPTTTIGSFPQTDAIRRARREHRLGLITDAQYQDAMQSNVHDAIQRQEQLGLDVLVHGEAERNDMVEYFAERLEGFQTTQLGWVQSYGSRCVKPAIVVADIERPAAMTLDWAQYAQSLSVKPVKGMLTGPVTIMCWTFPREDISRQQITEQLALALRDEVDDLQRAGIGIIQIDEPALREGLPLRHQAQSDYLNWAVNAFKVASGSAWPQTQIHTHMCYSDFNQIIDSVAALDADVITIETSRSNMALLHAFEEFDYPNEIGPGVYDIHSPNIPSQEWIEALLTKAAQRIAPQRLWVNPDCGLKTRCWEETEVALTNMVAAAKALREQYAAYPLSN
ncbi:5-methyltetrahydropteroyltriglutamate--homocysteine S-methyltransferase [Vibrio sp. SM6]|uniref:5-methyltetrahydropteroyltriglutamate--homocysteine S-methyltransferase n=1 Tax=Vibrio agarilyticus TaxID=2726741 RepID=A0A7X8TQJ4_9VIBR|nr:5-methyltetrahydropteroyltriglutamate--homocysteine S-methyltransferase [Vibrio agarilyticus]NLS13008.1 5-methyltetrahydropteroyltriglutamate--homocysteine S-methyltransferase [Vibrio agarilyticus]